MKGGISGVHLAEHSFRVLLKVSILDSASRWPMGLSWAVALQAFFSLAFSAGARAWPEVKKMAGMGAFGFSRSAGAGAKGAFVEATALRRALVKEGVVFRRFGTRQMRLTECLVGVASAGWADVVHKWLSSKVAFGWGVWSRFCEKAMTVEEITSSLALLGVVMCEEMQLLGCPAAARKAETNA